MRGMADDQQTGGMLALIPDDPEPLSADGGLDPGELHLTLLYLGDDVTAWTPEQTARLRELAEASAPGLDAVEARIVGRALFNPDGGPDGDRTPCVVYLVGDAPGLSALRNWARWALDAGEDYVTPPEQHDPFIPHVTAAEGTDLSALSYAGPVRFGALRLALAGEHWDFPLGIEPDSDRPDTPESKNLTFTPPRDVRDAASHLRGAMAHQVFEGKALDGGGVAWVAEHCGEPGQRWAAAMMRRAEVKGLGLSKGRREADDEDHDETDAALDAVLRMPPFDDEEMPRPRKRKRGLQGTAVRESPGALAPDGAGVETKVMSPDPRAARLRKYWAHGKGRAKWAGSPHPFRALRRQLRKHVKNPRVLNGLTANIFKLAKGVYPGQRPRGGRKSLVDWADVETKAAALPDVGEAALCEGIDDWGQVFADEDLSGFAPEDFADDGDPDAGEGKAADPDLLEISKRALIGRNLVVDDDDEQEEDGGDEESWEEIVGRDDAWEMDSDGVMHRIGGGDGADLEEPVGAFGPGVWRG